jgi:hypothetical protein
VTTAEAACPFDRPAAPTRHLVGREHQQLLIAGGVGGGGGVGEQPTDGGDRRGDEGVAVGSTPMTPSMLSASMAIAVVLSL